MFSEVWGGATTSQDILSKLDPSDCRRLSVTNALLTELSTVMGIPITGLLVVNQGGVPAY